MIQAYVLVSVEVGKNPDVISAMRSVPGVKQVHACWGRPDIFSFVEVVDEKTLAEVVLNTIQRIDGIQGTETHIVLPM